MFWMLSLALAAPLSRLEPELLAPGPAELEAALTVVEARLTDADTTGVAVSRLHNALAEQWVKEVPPCSDETVSPLAARAALVGDGHRDRVQALRAALSRASSIASSATVAPIAEEAQRARLADLSTRGTDHQRAYLEMLAWHESIIAPWTKRCAPTPVAPAAVIGPPPPTPASSDPPTPGAE